ncbi:hypothetical protein Poli38472_011855 [Pythium oligandrum]|uniref:Uncharacterized protein n=1 Tax=Pythium oligandrum TaxID=41045 RepID=A0A8K1C806_PYTOL|nr:hypothetical protein Poli38472_011855 [Pythium oligandrum]|eukprot:TMW58267.1 hypothetical protein Poli38472_011855 [Pythium oligandrum]
MKVEIHDSDGIFPLNFDIITRVDIFECSLSTMDAVWDDQEFFEFADDDAMLQAALAFVDDAGMLKPLPDPIAAPNLALPTVQPADQEHTSTSPPLGNIAKKSAAESPPKTRKRPPSQCVRDELIYLRSTVKDLEDQLEALLQAAAEPDVVDEMWKRVAARQAKERQRAQAENKRLLAILEEQIRAGKRLERLLLGRNDSVPPILLAKRLCSHHFTSPLDDPALESQLMDQIVDMYRDTDRILAHPRFQSVSLDRICSIEIQNGQMGPQFVATETRMIPFDFQSTADAKWEISKKYAYPKRVILQEYINADEGIITRLLERSLDLPTGPSHYRARSVRRHFVEHDRVVIVGSMVMDALQVAGQSMQGVCLRTHAWVILQPATDAGVACGPQRPASLRKLYYQAEPEVYDDGMSAEERRTSAGVLSNFVLNSVQLKADLNYQMLENLLMDRLRGLAIEDAVDTRIDSLLGAS